MGDIESLVGTMAGAGIGVYFLAVVWHGNIRALGHMLMGEEGYVEFLVALMLLGLVNKYGPQGKITSAITTMAIIAVMIKIASPKKDAQGNVVPSQINIALGRFMGGQATALDTIKALLVKEQ